MSVIESIIGSACVSCGADALRPLGTGGLCSACIDSLPWIGPLRCARCGRPLARGSSVCLVCREGSFSFDACLSLWSNSGPAKALVRAFKYGRDLRPLGFLPRILARLAEDAAWISEGPFIIVPVPADPRRKARRGWDPVSAIAKRIPGGVFLNALGKSPGDEQKRLGAAERLEQGLTGIGIRSLRSVSGDVVLVDDVVTTGATLSACSAILKKNGAPRVRCLTLVREL